MQHQPGAALGRRCTECTVWHGRHPFRRRAALALAIGIATAMAIGCSDSDRRSANGRSEPAVAGNAQRGAQVGDARAPSAADATAICPATGQWQLCSILERLERAGLAPRQDSGRVTEAPLSSPGVAIQLGRSELRIFVYADRASRERDQARLDTAKYVSASEPLSMRVEPTLIATENVLAILRSRNDHQRERVADALTAGPPQKPGTKG
jgi:hypothetical protein